MSCYCGHTDCPKCSPREDQGEDMTKLYVLYNILFDEFIVIELSTRYQGLDDHANFLQLGEL